MANKTRNTQYDILDKILADSDLAKRMDRISHASSEDGAEGAWITSKEEFDKLHKSVDDLEKYLRS
ncbi:MAG: hypothetical protein R3E79_23815 [Caldilineaceae bacterium]